MTPLHDLGRRAHGRQVTGPSFFSRTRAEIEASRLDRVMNNRDSADAVILFKFETVDITNGISA